MSSLSIPNDIVLILYSHIQVIDSQLAIEVLCHVTAKPHSLQREGRVMSGPNPRNFTWHELHCAIHEEKANPPRHP